MVTNGNSAHPRQRREAVTVAGLALVVVGVCGPLGATPPTAVVSAAIAVTASSSVPAPHPTHDGFQW